MKKLLSICLLSFIFLTPTSEDSRMVTNQGRITQVKLTGPTQTKIKDVDRTPARSTTQLKNSLSASFIPDPDISLRKSFVLTKNVGVIPKSEFSTHLGVLIAQDESWIYFRKTSADASLPVAFNSSKNKFFPISTVLQIRDVNPELKEQILKQGFEEFHYLPHLKLLFIQAQAESVLTSYGELKAQGLKVELEVLTGRHKAH